MASKWRPATAEQAEAVDRWYVPPECGGQIVEVAYGFDDAGAIFCQTTDASDGSVVYHTRKAKDNDDPINSEPR
jgi:hypothetical protein